MVINAEIPRDQEFFIHRVGRTGRNGLPGTAITLYEPGQEDQIAELEHMGIKFKPKTIQKGELVDTYDRNRRVQRKPKQEDTSLAIRGLVKKRNKSTCRTIVRRSGQQCYWNASAMPKLHGVKPC